MRERGTDLVALIGFFAAILGRCLCLCLGVVSVLFPSCAVIALQDNSFLGRGADRWKEVVVCCLRRLDEGNAI